MTPTNSVDDKDVELGQQAHRSSHCVDDHSPARSRVKSFLSSIVHFNADEDGRDSRSSFIFGRWKTLGSRRLIKFGMSTHSDAGDQDERRGMVAIPMWEETSNPMSTSDRFKTSILRRSSFNEVEKEDASVKNGGEKKIQMYRLQVTRQNEVGCLKRSLACVLACLNCGAHKEASTEQNLFLGLCNPNRWLIDFFYWLFRKGWLEIFAVSLAMFYLLAFLFAALIIWAAVIDSDCIRVGDGQFQGNASSFLAAQAFALSWHTLSTVGYGSTYPALSTQHDHENDVKCAFMNFICPLEALVGVIYGGFTGAVIFAKVTRVSQRAQVKFCQPLLIRFGKAVDERVATGDVFDDNITAAAQDVPKKKCTFKSLAKQVTQSSPFPVLEFRLANELHNIGGEIIDANVKVVVHQEGTDDSEFEVGHEMAKQIAISRMKRSSGKPPRLTSSKKVDVSSELSNETSSHREDSLGGSVTSEGSRKRYSVADTASAYLQGLNYSLAHKTSIFAAKKIKVDEETSSFSRIVPRMIFSNLSLDNSEHPMFNRVWSLRHVIDQNSPLLTKEARRKIILNGGWKWDWNTPEYIRKAIHFNEMIVSFTGVCSLSNFSVYKQKAYDTSQLVIGYDFVNMLYHSKRGKLKVDLSLLNDVVEQTNGGGESLDD